ncbi:ferrochelatase [Thermogymnomonas acidicola]|uniref:ferrochelatase n=1 Tax=Thermogymnomonas acidicola TaxID=399579 RepID=UPI00094662C1|nr:ferrochelatase [Thermogymnomonas acidicola]
MWAEIVRPLVGGAHVLYDAHSLPLRESGEEAYVGHFRRSAERISEMLGLDRYLWGGFQSIGRYGGDRWLRPSVYDVTRDIREGGRRSWPCRSGSSTRTWRSSTTWTTSLAAAGRQGGS